MPKSDILPLRRWPCWPGPYSRLFTGDFGRPQMFSPMRRSILYFALVRLVTSVSSSQNPRRLLCRVSPADRFPLSGSTNAKPSRRPNRTAGSAPYSPSRPGVNDRRAARAGGGASWPRPRRVGARRGGRATALPGDEEEGDVAEQAARGRSGGEARGVEVERHRRARTSGPAGPRRAASPGVEPGQDRGEARGALDAPSPTPQAIANQASGPPALRAAASAPVRAPRSEVACRPAKGATAGEGRQSRQLRRPRAAARGR